MGFRISKEDRELLKDGKVTIEQLFEQSEKEAKQNLALQKELEKIDEQMVKIGSDYISKKHEHLRNVDAYYRTMREKRELKKILTQLRKDKAKLKHDQKI